MESLFLETARIMRKVMDRWQKVIWYKEMNWLETMKTVWTDKNNTDNSLRLTWEPERWDQLPKNVFDKNNNNTDLVRQNTHSTADSNNHTKVNSYKDLRIQNQITPFLVRWVWAGLPVFVETHCQPTIYNCQDTPNVNFFKKTMW